MNLLIHAHTLKNEPLSPPLIGRFDERGGTIGRMETNALVLPDAQRLISRVQAELRFSKGVYSIRNVGSANPILLNGRPLMPGECITLVNGDEIVIGTYVMRASLEAEAGDESPERTVIDGRGLIQAQAAARHLPREPVEEEPSAAEEDPALATLFPDLLDTPVPTGPLDAPDVPPFPQEKNPFAGFTLMPEPDVPPVQAEAVSEPEPPGLAPAVAMEPPAAVPGSGRDPAFEPTQPVPRAAPDEAAASAPPVPSRPPLPLMPMPPVRSETPAMPAARPLVRPPVDAASAEVLWQAFCEGADIELQVPQGLNPDLMRIIGELLRHAVDGTLKLVASRSAAKQELRADLTTLQRRHNNPLKFSSDARVAIDRLLQPPSRDFIAGPAAFNEVMDDLLGHANGTAAGLHAALDAVLAQFEPGRLESQLGAQGVLDALLPMHRRAKLWELYLQHFKRLQHQAEDNYHEVFGAAFMRAYAEELARLEAARSAA